MPALDAALLRLGLVTLELLHPALAERITPELHEDKDAAGRVAADVERLADMLARQAFRNSRIPLS